MATTQRTTMAPPTPRRPTARRYTCRIVGCNDTDHTGKTLEVHHLTPLDAGGTDDASNLLTVCRQHHHEIESHERGRAKAAVTLRS